MAKKHEKPHKTAKYDKTHKTICESPAPLQPRTKPHKNRTKPRYQNQKPYLAKAPPACYINRMKFHLKIAIILAVIANATIATLYFLDADATWAYLIATMTWVSGIHPTLLLTIVTVIALYVSLSEGRRSQKHHEITIQPYITAQMKVSNMEAKDNPDIKLECMEIKIVNRGIGPGVVTNFTLFFDKEPIAMNNHKNARLALKETILDKSVGKFTAIELTSITKGDIIAIGEEQVVLVIKYNPKDENDETIDKFYKLDLRLDYQSMYEIDMKPCDTRD